MQPSAYPFWSFLVFAAQGLFLVADEFVYHRRREVPRWERVGHPLDTLSVLAPLLLTVLVPLDASWRAIYVALAAFSCLLITKDEGVHARLCSGGEQWLHAVLFVLHPLLFIAAWFLWKEGFRTLLTGQCLLVKGFMVYQIVYWNFLIKIQLKIEN